MKFYHIIFLSFILALPAQEDTLSQEIISIKENSTETNSVKDYEGCYKYPDIILERDREIGISNKKIDTSKLPPVYFNGLNQKKLPDPYISHKLSIQNCKDLCLYLSFKFSALMNGSECRCGDTLLPQSLKSSDDNCSTKCSGNLDESCGGGSNYTSIYNTGYINNNNNVNENKVEHGIENENKMDISWGIVISIISLLVGIILGVITYILVKKIIKRKIQKLKVHQSELKHKKKMASFMHTQKMISSSSSSIHSVHLDFSQLNNNRMSKLSLADSHDYSCKLVQKESIANNNNNLTRKQKQIQEALNRLNSNSIKK